MANRLTSKGLKKKKLWTVWEGRWFFPSENQVYSSSVMEVLALIEWGQWCNHYSPCQTKKVIDSLLAPSLNQNTQWIHSNGSQSSGSVTTEQLHCVPESHSLLYYTSIHLLLSQTSIIKHKRTIMLIFRLACKFGVPLLPRRMIAFHFKVWSSYSSLSFDYIAIRYANTQIQKNIFSGFRLWPIRPILFSCTYKQTH